jgi:hypothetical protein
VDRHLRILPPIGVVPPEFAGRRWTFPSIARYCAGQVGGRTESRVTESCSRSTGLWDEIACGCSPLRDNKRPPPGVLSQFVSAIDCEEIFGYVRAFQGVGSGSLGRATGANIFSHTVRRVEMWWRLSKPSGLGTDSAGAWGKDESRLWTVAKMVLKSRFMVYEEQPAGTPCRRAKPRLWPGRISFFGRV